MKISVYLLLIAFLLGCSSNGEKYVKKIPNSANILVVSGLGDFARVIGGSDWRTNETTFEVDKLNKSIENVFIAKTTSRFQLISLNTVSDFEPDRLETSSWDFSLKLVGDQKKLFDIGKQNNASHILVFSTYNTTDSKPYTNGFGRYQHSSSLNPLAINYAAVCSTLFNTETKKQVARNCTNNVYQAKNEMADVDIEQQSKIAQSELTDMLNIMLEGLLKTASWTTVIENSY